jgi:chromosome segregation ATPase
MTRTCEWSGCGKPFEPSRADARYCSASCRAAASRERRKEGEGVDAGETAQPAPKADTHFAERPDLVERLFLVEEKAQDLEEDLSALQARLGDVKALRRELAQAVAAMQEPRALEEVPKLDEEVIAGIEDRLAALEQAPSGDPWRKHFRASLAGLEHRLAVVEGRPGATSTASRALAERMDRLEGDYAALVSLVMNLVE